MMVYPWMEFWRLAGIFAPGRMVAMNMKRTLSTLTATLLPVSLGADLAHGQTPSASGRFFRAAISS